MSRGADWHRPNGVNVASPSSPVDLDEAEHPVAKKPRRADANAQDPDTDSEDEVEEPQSKRVRLNDYEDEHDNYGHDAEADDLFSPSDDDAEASVSQPVDMLTLGGVEPKIASLKAKDSTSPSKATFMDIYGRGSICREANQSRRDLDVAGLGACDPGKSKPDGAPWDFSKKDDRKLARDLVRKLEPDFIVGSPPCTAYCAWSQHMNYPKMDPGHVRTLVEEGRMHLQFMVGLYQLQLDVGRFFVHEHPATALSLDKRCIVKMPAHCDVHLVKGQPVPTCTYDTWA